jgi:alcohol dehydrogenase
LKTTPKPTVVVSTMKALVYEGQGKIELKEVMIPTISKSTDALIKVLKTTICGTDLGILHGKVPTVKPGTTLGHEGVGVIEQVGDAVRNFKKGDYVIISCITSDGTCEYCKNKCTPIAKMGAGSSAIPSMVPRLNMCAFLMPTTASI